MRQLYAVRMDVALPPDTDRTTVTSLAVHPSDIAQDPAQQGTAQDPTAQ